MPTSTPQDSLFIRTIHSDRGVPAAKPVAQLLSTLEITRSLTRPHTPNDNPFSESQFRTMKHRPVFPNRFAGIDDARSFCVGFFGWHNLEQRHSGIGFHTPASVYYGTADEVRAQRTAVLDAAFGAHPERFVHGRPTPPPLPEIVYVNPPQETTTTHKYHDQHVSPGLTGAEPGSTPTGAG